MPYLHNFPVITYRIDASNRLTQVNEAWTEFARGNHGDALLPGDVLGRNLLDAIANITVRELYVRMIQLARSGQTLRFHYRCDAPDRRRTFEMVIRPLEDGAVEFESTLTHEEPRPSLALLELGRPRDERLLQICSWCQKVEVDDGRWVPVEVAVDILRLLEANTFPQLTHGICEPCAAEWTPCNG
ncbi:MAG TPA: PAS domain-containing protein [Pseudomonadales bacterium]